MLAVRNGSAIMSFDNDRLSHWFAGALLSWVIAFLLLGLLVFHFWLKVPTATIATFAGICCALQMVATPWLFSARATHQNPSGRIAQRAATVIILSSVITLLFFYYLRSSFPEDIETRRFTTIGIGITILFCIGGLIRNGLIPSRHNDGKRSTPG